MTTTKPSKSTLAPLLIMAISGGIIPPLFGWLVDANRHELISNGLKDADALAQSANSSYWILIPCYVVILLFALWGHKINTGKRPNILKLAEKITKKFKRNN